MQNYYQYPPEYNIQCPVIPPSNTDRISNTTKFYNSKHGNSCCLNQAPNAGTLFHLHIHSVILSIDVYVPYYGLYIITIFNTPSHYP